MPQRTRFYMNAGIWEKTISSSAFHVYAFLSWCADRSGACYPAVPEIARRCHISVTTVRKALRELREAGLVHSQTQHKPTKSGGRRQTANAYFLTAQIPHPPPSDPAPAPSQIPWGMGSDPEGEINDKRESIKCASSIIPYEEQELNDILTGLNLDLYEDEDQYVNTIELTVREMYYRESVTVDGEQVPRERVRERLRQLDIHHLEAMRRRVGNHMPEMKSAGKYLMACIYNAPMDFNADLMALCATENMKT